MRLSLLEILEATGGGEVGGTQVGETFSTFHTDSRLGMQLVGHAEGLDVRDIHGHIGPLPEEHEERIAPVKDLLEVDEVVRPQHEPKVFGEKERL